MDIPEAEKAFMQELADKLTYVSGSMTWKDKRRKKQFDLVADGLNTYNTAFKGKGALTPADFTAYLTNAINMNATKEMTENWVRDLTDADMEMLSYFRYAPDERTSARMMYIMTRYGSYKLISSLESGATTTWCKSGKKRIIDNIKDRYKKAVKNKERLFIYVDGPYPPVNEYLQKLEEVFLTHPEYEIETPVAISNDVNIPAFYQFDLNEIKEDEGKPWDTWKKWLEMRMQPVHVDLFMAWIYSIFDANNTGRQTIWLHDGGYSGKSEIAWCLNKYLDGVGCGSIDDAAFANQFVFSNCFGKRLLINGDCRNPQFVSSDAVHKITGGDLCRVEFKNMTPFTARICAKIFVCSNYAPQVNISQRNEVTRLIYIPLKDNKELPDEYLKEFCAIDKEGKVKRLENGEPVVAGGELGKKLLAEMDSFLCECKKKYDVLCPKGKDLILDDAALKCSFDGCISPQELEFERFCDQHYILGSKADKETQAKVWDHFSMFFPRDVGLKPKDVYGAFKRYLEDVYGVKPFRPRDPDKNGKRERYFVGLTIKKTLCDFTEQSKTDSFERSTHPVQPVNGQCPDSEIV